MVNHSNRCRRCRWIDGWMASTHIPITVHGIPLGCSYYRKLYFCTTCVRIKLELTTNDLLSSFTHQQCTNSPTLIMAGAWTPGFMPMRIYHVICHLALLFSPLLTTSTWRTRRCALPPTWPSLTTRIASSASIVAYPSQISEALDEQAHAEQSCEHNWCWVSVWFALVFSKFSDFNLVFEAPEYRGMSVLRLFFEICSVVYSLGTIFLIAFLVWWFPSFPVWKH